MKKLRCSLATIVLLALGGLSFLQGMGAASLASAASHHASASSTVAFIRPPCGTASDC